MTTLQHLRNKWEKDMEPKIVIADTEYLDTVLVVVQYQTGFMKGKYCLHRYFTIGNEWNCSVDIQNVDNLQTCLDKLSKPFEKALKKINNKDMDRLYHQVLEEAEILMAENDELEPTSALRQAASYNGIPYGEEMGDFMRFARRLPFCGKEEHEEEEPRCKKCDTILDFQGYCADISCPYSSHKQDEEIVYG